MAHITESWGTVLYKEGHSKPGLESFQSSPPKLK